jgi:hypothetical protein
VLSDVPVVLCARQPHTLTQPVTLTVNTHNICNHTTDECDAIVAAARPRLAPSVIVNAEASDKINGTQQV